MITTDEGLQLRPPSGSYPSLMEGWKGMALWMMAATEDGSNIDDLEL
jgi:hypothetical protein